jgi:hypothetical protein
MAVTQMRVSRHAAEPFRVLPRRMVSKAILARRQKRETIMNFKTKTFAALTALTVATTFALPSNEAQARGRGWAIGAGILGAAVIGGAIAASAQPVYVEGYRSCRWVANYDRFGNFLGNTKVCRYY